MMFEYILRPERVIQPKEEAIVDAEIVAHQDFDLKDHRIQELEERISKAREILGSYTPMPRKAPGFLSEIIRQALDALEGK